MKTDRRNFGKTLFVECDYDGQFCRSVDATIKLAICLSNKFKQHFGFGIRGVGALYSSAALTLYFELDASATGPFRGEFINKVKEILTALQFPHVRDMAILHLHWEELDIDEDPDGGLITQLTKHFLPDMHKTARFWSAGKDGFQLNEAPNEPLGLEDVIYRFQELPGGTYLCEPPEPQECPAFTENEFGI